MVIQGQLGLRRGVFRGLEDLLVLKNRAFYMLLIACLTSSIRPSPRALWPLEVGSCAPLATFPLLLTTNLEFKIQLARNSGSFSMARRRKKERKKGKREEKKNKKKRKKKGKRRKRKDEKTNKTLENGSFWCQLVSLLFFSMVDGTEGGT